MQLIYEKSREGRRGIRLDALDVPQVEFPAGLQRTKAASLPDVSEFDVVRHFTNLSKRNFGLDSHL